MSKVCSKNRSEDNLLICSLLSFALGYLWSINYGRDYQDGGVVFVLGLFITITFFLSLLAGEDGFKSMMVKSLSATSEVKQAVARKVLLNQYAFFFIYFSLYFSIPFICSGTIVTWAGGNDVSWGGELFEEYGALKVFSSLIFAVVTSGALYSVGRVTIPKVFSTKAY